MGGSVDRGGKNAKPIRHVEIAPFALAKTEVTFEQYDVFARATNRRLPSDQGWGRESRPVVEVNWRDARADVVWLSKKTGLSYRLPSEAEWECAAEAGTQTKYRWGDSLVKNKANCKGCGSRWDGAKTAPVASFVANAFGLHDMHGNVWEWTQDCWNDSYAGAPSAGEAWARGDCHSRVLRGGSGGNKLGELRSAFRKRGPAWFRFYIDGFPVAQDL